MNQSGSRIAAELKDAIINALFEFSGVIFTMTLRF
jgi:hypothetical protein